ncbi:hypothetical protein SCHPADRAFT_908516 [Schizopora paradoxa]|uniref:Protein kinase domain-containing protein n=1 Tax=Schizopora paradoxa TaxID=27342 RepID=A0A0H2RB31_9AGAM|nr:hypothetical protein SCHPADRAFT_908516 [Schizopora paradoxa]
MMSENKQCVHKSRTPDLKPSVCSMALNGNYEHSAPKPDEQEQAGSPQPDDSNAFEGALEPWEIEWRDRFERLKAKGYILRPRFRPGWQPSWLRSGITGYERFRYEDFLDHEIANAIDATRSKDNSIVMIKRVPEGDDGTEFEIAKFFTTLRDPRNHCVPILDSFEIEGDEAIYMVMPLLRDFNDPPFYAVKDVVDFVHQTLEGTKFMHNRLVAHRDLARFNIMMDGTPLYPKGFHPSRKFRSPSAQRFVRGRYRLHAPPVVYYFVDFGLSTKYEGDGPYRAWGIDGQDRDAPELQELGRGFYDPFALDIFTLGNVYKKYLLDKYANLKFLRPLVEIMTRKNPTDRPTINEAMFLFEPIYQNRTRPKFRKRLHPFHEDRTTRCFRDSVAAYRDMGHMSWYFVSYWYRLLTLQRPWKAER